MAADEYYDAVGEVLSYVLSAGDLIKSHNETNRDSDWSEERFTIVRDNTELKLHAPTDQRYFKIIYSARVSDFLKSAYQSGDTLKNHMEEYNVDDELIGDERLNEIVAYHRLKAVDIEDAVEVISDLHAHDIHTVCRLGNEAFSAPDGVKQEHDEGKLWNGVRVVGLLYPYEESFGPSDYEEIAQNVISLGGVVDNQMADLDVMEDTDFDPVSNI